MQDSVYGQDVQNALMVTSLFKPRRWMVAVDLINRLILSNQVMISVLAEHQGGKSSCIQLLVPGLDKSIKSLVMRATVYSTAVHVVKRMAQYLDMPGNSSLSLTSVVNEINSRKEHFVLIIDDAHCVPYTLLQDMLQQIKIHEDINYFHVCLFSDFSITKRLISLESNRFKNMIYSMELGPLSESETKTCVLKSVGATRRFTDEAFQLFYRQTGGLMAMINRDKDTFFQTDASAFRRFADIARQLRAFFICDVKQLFSPVSLSLGIAAAVFLSFIFWQSQIDPEERNEAKAPVSSSSLLASEASVLPSPRVFESRIPSLALAVVRAVVQSAPLRAPVMDDEDSSIEKLVIMDSVVVIPKPIPGNPGINTTPAKSVLAAGKPLVGKRLALTSPRIAVKSKHLFTIQLLASQSSQELRHFIVRQHLVGKVRTHTLRKDGKLWYVLTMGNYAKKEQAQHIIRTLSPNLAKLHPWVRSVDEFSAVG